MGIISYDSFGRSGLRVCDECDRVLLSDGRTSRSTQRDSSPDELAPHFRSIEDLRESALGAGWSAATGNRDAEWICPECARRPR